jgi:hypothetical protein
MRTVLLALALAVPAARGADGIVELANGAIDELSGIVVSRADPQVLWGHNDTGSGPYLFRIGHAGEDLGATPVGGVRASDWEDIAAFEHPGGAALLIGDIGNNLAMRSVLTLYAVSDPGRAGAPRLLWRLAFRFPDGARDCEALAVDPVDRSILLVTKRDTPPRVYRLPLPERTPGETQVAEFVTELADWPPAAGWLKRFANSPTALDISRDGSRAVLVTPSRAYVYRRMPGASWALALRHPTATLELPAHRLGQIEAAAFSADGRELIVGSEGRPGRLARIALPQ